MGYNVYQDNELIAEEIEEKEYTVEGLTPNTEYSFSVSEVIGDKESEKSEAVTVTTLPIEVVSRETLEMAIENADVGDTIKLAGGFTLEKDVAINKDITIDGNNHTITVDIPESEVQDSGFRVTEGKLNVKNINVELSEGANRAFLLHTTAGSFNLKDSSIVGNDTSAGGNKGVSSSTDKGVITIDNVVLSGLRTGVYRHGDSELSINNSTFDGNYIGMTIEGNTVPTLTNNTFEDNGGDISASYDSEIREEIAEEAESADNNNAFDGGKPKYNWSVTGVSLSPKTSTADAGTGGSRDLTATVEPEHALDKGVTFSTEDVEGLSVSSSGLLEWTADTPAGTYETTVTTDDGGFTDTHVLTLTELEPEPEPEPEEPED